MNSEGGNFEQRIREHLEGFSPEVPQGMWEQVSAHLPVSTPTAPTDQPETVSVGTSLIKKIIVAALLGGSLVGGWVLLNSEPTQAPVSEQQIPDQTKPKDESEVETAGALTETQHGDLLVQTGSSPNALQAETSMPANEEVLPSTAQSPSLQVPEHKQDGATGSTPTGQASASVSGTNKSASPSGATSQSVEKLASATPLKLILSSRAGFAPLRVTAMSNQQGRPVEFILPDGTKTRSGAGVSFGCSEPGTYSICCESTGQQICENITVLGRISNAFSPNGDGVNERFAVEGADSIDGELRIYTRDGRLQFRTRSLSQGWDGRLSTGEFAPEGTYIFDIFVGSSEAGPIQQKGTLQLFR
jgi:gliding motility-associated-like protein